MNLPNFLTGLRIFLSPFFLIIFLLPEWTGGKFAVLSVWLYCFLFIVMEFSDLFDGMAARAYNLVSDFGKIFDPFADVFSRLTYFLCFVGIGIMPIWIFAVILYREITILFFRIIMMRRGIAMGARMGGKLKAWAYAFAGIGGLIYVSLQRLGIFTEYSGIVLNVTYVLFLLAGAAALISLSDYIFYMRKTEKK